MSFALSIYAIYSKRVEEIPKKKAKKKKVQTNAKQLQSQADLMRALQGAKNLQLAFSVFAVLQVNNKLFNLCAFCCFCSLHMNAYDP